MDEGICWIFYILPISARVSKFPHPSFGETTNPMEHLSLGVMSVAVRVARPHGISSATIAGDFSPLYKGGHTPAKIPSICHCEKF